MKNYGHQNRGYSLRPRSRGVFANFERSPFYQGASRGCIEAEIEAFSLESFICSGVIDFGITAFIEGQALNDLIICLTASK
jgi:hypothetical protein